MGLLSFLKRDDGKGQAPLGAATPDDVQRARTRARQRLIGAVVLLGIGIVGFPLLFETQPRPIAVNLPIEIPRKDAVPPLAVPPPRPAAQGRVATAPAATAPASAAKAVDEAAAPPPKPQPEATQSRPAARTPPEPTPAAKPDPAKPDAAQAEPPAAPPKPAGEAARAQALLEGTAAPGRYVVQVGAYAEEKSAREARLKVERLGLKTYTQVVDTGSGKRIRVRVGPYPSRDEADRAAGKLKSAGLPSAILTL